MIQMSSTFLMAMLVLLPNLGFGQDVSENFSFFITSEGVGKGANLEAIAGADRHCQALAEEVGAGSKTWRAYLSTWYDGAPALNARDRIGPGPWYNVRGELVAEDVEDLHSENNNLNKQTALNERGEVVNGRGDEPNRHDILTGSNADGSASELTCNNWMSRSEGQAMVGHFDREGGGDNPTSWNGSHPSSGCSQADLQSTGGDGLFYCFALPGASN